MGNAELVALLDLVLGLVEAGKGALKDGKIDVSDLGQLLLVFPLVQPAIVGIDKVPAELAALSLEDAEALVAHVVEKLAIEDAHARSIIDAALKVVFDGVSLFKAIKA